jgi:regulator of protease activity HflC (stomatin/prohibitin superfamily)
MAIKTVVGIVITLLVLGMIGGVALAVVNSTRGRKMRSGVIVAVISLIAAVLLGTLNAGLVLVQPNEVGVVFRQTASGDAALREPLQAGLSWVLPFVDQVIIYDVGQQSVTMSGVADTDVNGRTAVRATSSDGQVINLDVTVIYRIDPSQINFVHRNWRGGFLDAFIVPQTRSEVRDAVSQYSAEEIYSGGRATLEAQVTQSLGQKLDREGFILTDFLVRNIAFSQEFTDAIEQKQIAQQQAQQAAFRVDQARQEAEQARVEAQGRADSAAIEADGEARSITIKAAAQADALNQINQVLSQNPELIQWQYVNTLGDNVRLIIIPSNSPFLFDIQQLMEQAGAQEVSTPLPTPTAPSDNTQP